MRFPLTLSLATQPLAYFDAPLSSHFRFYVALTLASNFFFRTLFSALPPKPIKVFSLTPLVYSSGEAVDRFPPPLSPQNSSSFFGVSIFFSTNFLWPTLLTPFLLPRNNPLSTPAAPITGFSLLLSTQTISNLKCVIYRLQPSPHFHPLRTPP